MRQKKWTIPALIAGSVLFCVIPYLYQWVTGNNSDWQAWWAFGTFLIALIAAIIAYKEYNAHISATEPLIIVRVAKIKGSALDTIFLTNVGGSIAIDVKFSLSPGIRLKKLCRRRISGSESSKTEARRRNHHYRRTILDRGSTPSGIKPFSPDTPC